jgi:hypothetical protein
MNICIAPNKVEIVLFRVSFLFVVYVYIYYVSKFEPNEVSGFNGCLSVIVHGGFSTLLRFLHVYPHVLSRIFLVV